MQQHDFRLAQSLRDKVLSWHEGVDQLEVEMEGGVARRHTGEGDVSLVVRSDKPLCGAPDPPWTLRAQCAPLWIVRGLHSTYRPALAVST